MLGISSRTFFEHAPAIAALYSNLGGAERFSKPAPPSPEINEETDEAWLDDEEVGRAVQRRSTEIQAQVRDRRKAAALRLRYENVCMFCGARLSIGDREYYSEAAHIRAIGHPHNGPDKVANMIVLCPNHHLQFDRGMLRIKKQGSNYIIISRVRGDILHNKLLVLRHALADDCIEWHFNWFDLGKL